MCSRDLKLKEIFVDNNIKNLCQNCIDYGLEVIEISHEVKKETDKDTFIIENIGYEIMKKRNQLGLKQEELAMKLGIKVNSLAKIESNKLELDFYLLKKIEKILGIRLR